MLRSDSIVWNTTITHKAVERSKWHRKRNAGLLIIPKQRRRYLVLIFIHELPLVKGGINHDLKIGPSTGIKKPIEL